MDEFSTLTNVIKLFEEKGCPNKNSIYLALLKDTRKASGMVSGMDYPYSGLLLNISEEGIGYYYLKQAKFSLTINLEKLIVDKDNYNFIPKENIKSIEVKKFALLDKKRKSLIIKTTDKKTHYLYGKVNEPLIQYNDENMEKLISRYEKK